jgi:hypothetical protein
VAGAVLVPAFSTSNAAVAPVTVAALVTSAVETASDSPTDVSFALLRNTSWTEVFLPLSDVIRGILHISKKP